MKTKLLEEHDTHYVCHDGTAQFRVPKQGLSEELHGKIRALGPQNMASGGEAKKKLYSEQPRPTYSFNLDGIPSTSAGQTQAAIQAANAQPSQTGAQLGLGTIPANASFSLPAPSTGPALPAGMKLAPKSEKTLADTGETSPNGQPVVREVDAFVDKPLPSGLRLKGDGPIQTSGQPTTGPKGAGGRSGPLPGVTDVEQATQEERAAIEVKGRLEAEQARQTAQALVEGDKVLQQHALQQKEIGDRSHAMAADLMSKHDGAVQELRNMDATVDAGRYWASRPTGQKILGIIGLALGAFGTGPDGINRSAAMLTQAIDRDIDAQKAEHSIRIQKGKAAVDAAQSMYAMNHQIFQNDLAADAATHATAWARVQNNIDKINAAAKGPQSQAAAAQLSALALAKQGEFKNKAANIVQDNATKWLMANQKGATGNAAESKELHSAEAAAQNSLDFIRDLRQGLKDTHSAIPGKTAFNQNVGKDAAKLQANQTGLMLELKNVAKLGVLSKTDEKILDDLTGDPSSISTFEGTKNAKLDALEAMVKRGIENQRRSTQGARAQ